MVLANIVAFFLVRIVGRNLESLKTMARNVDDAAGGRSRRSAAWLVGFLLFFPILWMVLTSFKTELEAFAMPPSFLFFHGRRRTIARCRSAATIFTTR